MTAIMRPVLPNSARCGEEARRIAGGAAVNDADVLLAQTGVFQLAAIGLHQIEMNLRPEIAVTRGALIQEQQRIAHVNRVGVEDLFEEIVGVGELRFELGAHLVTDLIAAAPDAGTDGRPQIARQGAELTPHLADTFFHDARHGSSPAGMECGRRRAA